MKTNSIWIEQLTHELNAALEADADAFAAALARAVVACAFDEEDEDRGPLTPETLTYMILDCVSDQVGGQLLDESEVSEALDRGTSIVGRHEAAA